ncbi:MAG TPA: response regulator [Nevskiaceae bacterium]|nr:response regulator [Nevskiaceae bacterium]
MTDLRDARLLLIDDQAANLRLLEQLLQSEGFAQVVSTTDPRRSLDLVKAFDPDLVILDLKMPQLDGYAVLEQLRREAGPDQFRPVLVLTADDSLEARRRALALGARDFLAKPFDALEAMLRVWNLLELRALYQRLRRADPAASAPAPPLSTPDGAA